MMIERLMMSKGAWIEFVFSIRNACTIASGFSNSLVKAH
ncbi:hypothetical protein EV13_0593 [Prochlorococcus sp. MIT 0702]|nr:hypothetical protein EV12_1795 [Prochlorococcus sp. MIT 0701]KGG30261.1 hypothetical protein EV13_0593 [Prochlorococcus sp. MIT 0702]